MRQNWIGSVDLILTGVGLVLSGMRLAVVAVVFAEWQRTLPKIF